MPTDGGRGERGFSLVELMIALTVTLLVSGATFSLVASGQTAFRREPALADRQQNIRVAMDLISQDLYRAGYGLPQFAQAFTDSLDGVGDLGPGGEPIDELEIVAASDCPLLSVCALNTQGTGASVFTWQEASACYTFPTLVILGDPEKWGLYWAEEPGAGSSAACPGSGSANNGHFTLPHGQAPLVNPPGGLGGWIPEWMMTGQMIRYRIAVDAEGTPNLERSAFGGQLDLDGNSTWRIIARGVEDLQVEYMNGVDWQDTPGTITCGTSCTAPTAAEYDTIIRRVQLRLSARSMEANLQGQTMSAVGDAVRGQLVTQIAPRTAVATLGMANGEL